MSLKFRDKEEEILEEKVALLQSEGETGGETMGSTPVLSKASEEAGSETMQLISNEKGQRGPGKCPKLTKTDC